MCPRCRTPRQTILSPHRRFSRAPDVPERGVLKDRFGSNCEDCEPPRSVCFTAETGSADGACRIYEFTIQ